MIQVPEDLKGLYLEALLTGSRVMCNPPVLDTDLDVVLLVTDGDAALAIERQGYTLTTDATYGVDLNGFCTFRKGDVNLIVTSNAAEFHSWAVATRWCTELNLRSKTDRATFFDIVRHGPGRLKDAPPSDLPSAGVQPWMAS